MPETHSETLALLRDFGFPVAPEADTAAGFDGLLAYFRRIGDARDTLPYDIDGVVYKLDDYDQQATMGFVSRAAPIRRKYASRPSKPAAVSASGATGKPKSRSSASVSEWVSGSSSPRTSPIE